MHEEKGSWIDLEPRLAVGSIVCVSIVLSTAMRNVEDLVSSGRSKNEADAVVIFWLSFPLVYQNVLNRSLRQADPQVK